MSTKLAFSGSGRLASGACPWTYYCNGYQNRSRAENSVGNCIMVPRKSSTGIVDHNGCVYCFRNGSTDFSSVSAGITGWGAGPYRSWCPTFCCTHVCVHFCLFFLPDTPHRHIGYSCRWYCRIQLLAHGYGILQGGYSGVYHPRLINSRTLAEGTQITSHRPHRLRLRLRMNLHRHCRNLIQVQWMIMRLQRRMMSQDYLPVH